MSEFRTQLHQLADWVADYMENIEQYPVLSNVAPKHIYNQLPPAMPIQAESLQNILRDMEQIIMPGITHWQHPAFHAYFPANSSEPSVLAELITAAIGAQCMVWQTSPAAAELEQRVMEWLRDAMGLPRTWEGVIQDTASSATLCAILTAREQALNQEIMPNKAGSTTQFAVYCSTETHSSIEKAVKIAGIGVNKLRKVATDELFALSPIALEAAIVRDLRDGIKPLCVIATIGTTGTTAIDPLPQIGEICRQHNIWLHIDAAYAGVAAILPEQKHILYGVEYADSFVTNPHKWLFTNFDCSAYYVKNKQALLRTFEIMPEYLKTDADQQVNNYRDWGIALGRRFRALKLWFVLRSYGLENLQRKLREHIQLAQLFAVEIQKTNEYEILAPIHFNLVCFRHRPADIQNNETALNEHNVKLMQRINQSGKAFLSHTKLNGKYTIRAVFGQTNVSEQQVWNLLALLKESADMG
jgi:aromatic-L-amino-acid decarboxylase